MGCRNLPEEKQTYAEPKIVRKGTDNNIKEDSPRIERNISNKNKIIQSDEGRKSSAQDKTCYACNSTEHKLKNAQREIY